MRNREAERPRRLEIDDQLEARRLGHRQVGRLGAFQNLVHVEGGAPVAISEVRPVGHQPAGIRVFAVSVDRGQALPGRERHN